MPPKCVTEQDKGGPEMKSLCRVRGLYTVVMGAALLLPSVLVSGAAAAQDTLNVGGIYGGVWADSIRAAILTPYQEKTNTKMNIEEGISSVTLAKLRQQKSAPALDVVWIDRVVSDQAILEGLVDTIDPAVLTNLPDITPKAVIKDKAGNIVALTTGYWAAGIAYNTKEIKTRPQSWLDLANPEYKGKLAIYTPENAIGLPLLLTIAELKGGNPDNMDPGFAFFRGLAKNGAILFSGSPAGGNLLANGEAAIATLASTQVWDLQAKGHPIAYVAPKEGVVGGDIRVHIVKGAKNKAAAMKLANFAISPEAQEVLAERLLVGPVNHKAKLKPEVAAKMPWGENGSPDTIRLVDPYVIIDKRDAWTARWNKEVAE
jgi:putative spermidine/putrescine transport system substrate-binding protein